jgi:hypothetical protein
VQLIRNPENSVKTHLSFPFLAVSVLLAGCGDSFTPGELAGVYRLSSVEGTTPPYIERATTECDQSIVDGLLVLTAEGTHDLSLSVELDCTRGGGDVSIQERTYAGTFTVNDDDLEFTAPGSAVGDVVFGGRAGETSVAVDLPATVVEIGPLLHLRFEQDVCPEVCPT